MAFSVYGLAVVFAPAIGPTLGGWITDNYSWHWIFLINIPVGIVSLFLTAALVREPAASRLERERQLRDDFRVDWQGFVLTVLGIGCLEMFVDRGQREDWFASRFITTMAVTSGVSLVALVWWELRQKIPWSMSACSASRVFWRLSWRCSRSASSSLAPPPCCRSFSSSCSATQPSNPASRSPRAES